MVVAGVIILLWIVSDPTAAAHEVHHWMTQVGVFLTSVSK